MSKQKIHIGKNGPAPCKATKRACRYGGDETHYDNMADANAAYEQQLAEEAGGSFNSSKTSKDAEPKKKQKLPEDVHVWQFKPRTDGKARLLGDRVIIKPRSFESDPQGIIVGRGEKEGEYLVKYEKEGLNLAGNGEEVSWIDYLPTEEGFEPTKYPSDVDPRRERQYHRIEKGESQIRQLQKEEREYWARYKKSGDRKDSDIMWEKKDLKKKVTHEVQRAKNILLEIDNRDRARQERLQNSRNYSPAGATAEDRLKGLYADAAKDDPRFKNNTKEKVTAKVNQRIKNSIGFEEPGSSSKDMAMDRFIEDAYYTEMGIGKSELKAEHYDAIYNNPELNISRPGSNNINSTAKRNTQRSQGLPTKKESGKTNSAPKKSGLPKMKPNMGKVKPTEADPIVRVPKKAPKAVQEAFDDPKITLENEFDYHGKPGELNTEHFLMSNGKDRVRVRKTAFGADAMIETRDGVQQKSSLRVFDGNNLGTAARVALKHLKESE